MKDMSKILNSSICLGFDDMDSIYASPADFMIMKHRDRIRGLHLLEYFVKQCNEIGVRKDSSSGSCNPPSLSSLCLHVFVPRNFFRCP